jgi:hypothetical protein
MVEEYVTDSRFLVSYTPSSGTSIPQNEDKFDAGKSPWPHPAPCLIQPALRKSYLSLKIAVTESVKRIRLKVSVYRPKAFSEARGGRSMKASCDFGGWW